MPIVTKIEEGLAEVVIAEPATGNALSIGLANDLRRGFERLSSDPNVRVILLRGEGKVFCSGHDLRELRKAKPEDAAAIFEETAGLAQQIKDVGVPVLAGINGPAVGAGVQIALACDLIICAQEAYFQTPGGAKGWFCFTPAVEVMQRIPSAVAHAMLLTGARLTATRAKELGVVNEVIALADLYTCARSYANGILGGDRDMLAQGKAFLKLLHKSNQIESYVVASQKMAETLFTPSAQRRIQKGAS